MANPDDRIETSTEEARAGATPGMTRYILAISLVLIVIIFAVMILR